MFAASAANNYPVYDSAPFHPGPVTLTATFTRACPSCPFRCDRYLDESRNALARFRSPRCVNARADREIENGRGHWIGEPDTRCYFRSDVDTCFLSSRWSSSESRKRGLTYVLRLKRNLPKRDRTTKLDLCSRQSPRRILISERPTTSALSA